MTKKMVEENIFSIGIL